MLISTAVPVVSLKGAVNTNAEGIDKIMQLYTEAARYKNTEVSIDFYDMTWIDANLASLLYAITSKLRQEKGVRLTTDYDFLYRQFKILFRNGWLRMNGLSLEDPNQTTVPCSRFRADQVDGYMTYLKNELMLHRGMAPLKDNIRRKIQTDLAEVYQNTFRHSKTTDPFYICGQYYPDENCLKLTMVDLGVGFLAPIRAFTGNRITTSSRAIRWALVEGNTSRIDDPALPLGGLGLQSIHEYCCQHNGCFQIYSGNSYFSTASTALPDGCIELPFSFPGSVVNITFNLG